MLDAGRAATGQRDAILSATGFIDGRKVSVCAMEYGFIGGSMGVVVGETITRTGWSSAFTRYSPVGFSSGLGLMTARTAG